MDNRSGLLVDMRIAEANGRAEREVALQMVDDSLPGSRRLTVGADRGYDTRDFVAGCRERHITPHVAQYEHERRRSAIDGRTTQHEGYLLSQRCRMRIEQIFGWLKTVAGLRRTRHRGKRRTQLAAHIAGAAYNLLRMAKLMA